jgi:beta-galactosidase/beta-glucuronidase
MKRYLLCVIFSALLIHAIPSVAQIRGFRQEQLKEWEFSKDGSSWQTVTVPHSYNAEDGHSPEYYRGKATYRCDLKVSDVKKSHFLYFEGVGQAAVVKVNGEQVASHKGGYTPFCVDITEDLSKGVNHVEVVCDNSEDVEMIPVTSDFNKNGGIHNPAWLLIMDDVYLSPEEYGMYRIRCETPEVSKKKAVTNVRTKLVNTSNKDVSILVRVQLLEANGALGYQADREVPVRAFSEYDFDHEFILAGLHLWDGLNDPYLYTLRVELFKGKRMMDIAETKIGYRSIEMDPERGFFLNGHPYPLRGVAMHQDMDGKASAMSEADYRRDYRIIKELGANFVRLAHYPHNDMAFRLCDSLGIVVQTEIPWVNVCGANASQNYFNNIHHQMTEMVSNLYNHPSIAFWGMWNELDTWGNNNNLQGPLDTRLVAEETEKLYNHAKELDPDRYVGFTDDSRLARDGYKDLKGDFCSQNIYYGWYWTPNDFSGLTTSLKKVREARPDCPINVSEYGVGINPYCHVWNDADAVRDTGDDSRHYEEYGNRFHESYVRQILAMPWLNFTSVWVMFDFPVASRKEGFMDSDDGRRFTANNDRKYMNDKGIVTRDRQTKKDVFYLYKSLWNKSETTVHITSSRLKYFPSDQDLCIKVYSNAKYLTLYQNGRLVSKLTSSGESSGVVWTFPAVRMKTGEDTFKVVSNNGVSDEITLLRAN